VLTHILVPLHPKIRLSFAQLYTAGLDIVYKAQSFAIARAFASSERTKQVTTLWKSRIFHSSVYTEALLRDGKSAIVERLCDSVPLSRYVGVIRIEALGLDAFDVLLDTTSTERNLNCLAVLQLGKAHPHTSEFCRFLRDSYGGRWFA
jgi:hypothetical protein